MDTRIRSLFIMHVSMLFVALGSSIIFTGVWPYMQLLDPDVTLEQYGFVVAADAFGNMIFSPIFGYLSDYFGTVRWVGLTTNAMFAGGNVFYALLPMFPRGDGNGNPRIWLALTARFIVGMGTAINAAARGYISKVTTLEERTTHVALYSMFQTLGLVLGPAFQAALTPIGEKEIGPDPTFVFDMYTATGWVSAFTAVLGFILFLPWIFVEHQHPPKGLTDEMEETDVKETNEVDEEKPKPVEGPPPTKPKPKQLLKQYSRTSVLDGVTFPMPFEEEGKKREEGEENQQRNLAISKPDVLACITCVYGFFAYFCSFVLLETLMTPIALDQWGWDEEDAILYIGVTMSAGGVLAGFCFATIGPLSRRFDERLILLICGCLPLVLGRLICLPTGDAEPRYAENLTEICYGTDDSATTTMMSTSTAMAPELHQEISGRAAVGDVDGCPYCWCFDIPQLGVAQFMVGYVFCTMGFPYCIALIASIFSKVLGNSPQGFWMGIMTMAGSLARVIGPIGFAFIYEEFGTYLTFGLLALIVFISAILIVISYKRLVPKVDTVPANVIDSRKSSAVSHY